jgi:NDP-sugar pyrophosphorylase family protein
MKCIILAAGRGERMMPLTVTTPKPLLEVNGMPMIEYVLGSLGSDIDEVIIVVKYFGEKIKKHLGKKYMGLKIKYVEGSSRGNVYSFLNTRKYLKDERFLLIYGDEIPDFTNVENCLAKDLSMLIYKSRFGNTWLKDGVMVLNTDIFNYKPNTVNFKDLVDAFILDHKVSLVKAKGFIGEINTPEDIKRVERKIKNG